jgi:hypothetical protein
LTIPALEVISSKTTCMAKIRIIHTPSGFAPERIRDQWKGIEIPLADNPIPAGKVALRIGTENQDGYQVKGTEAVKALREAGKNEAADFWEDYKTGNFTFKKEVCELIISNGSGTGMSVVV